MHLLIVNCSPRVKKNSNTERILSKFIEGFTANGNSVESYCLSERNTWDKIESAFYANDDILFAIPLFVESIPGLMLSFLEKLEPKQNAGEGRRTRLSFILQGGFAEASQLRCCETYLEKLPGYLGCEYGGTLIKGDMFGLRFLPEATTAKQIAPFIGAGREFASKGGFDKAWASEFAKPEFFSKGFIFFFKLIMPMQRKMFESVAKGNGCTERLDDRPLEEYLQK